MDFINLVALIGIIYLIVNIKKLIVSTDKINLNQSKLESKIEQIQKLVNQLQSSATIKDEVPTSKDESLDSTLPNILSESEVLLDVCPEIIPEADHEPLADVNQNAAFSGPELFESVHLPNGSSQVIPPTSKKVIIKENKKSWVQKFKEENPDIEKFIGENLINKIGILILVLGISFFVKYAIDKDWIGEPARVGIGVLAGAIVLGLAHKLKANYKAFSSVFVAGAFAIFYFTIAIAFQEYQLFNQTIAFAIMVIITIFSSFISVSYNRQELGVLSLIAGFAVPFMVSTGEGNYIILLSYIAILNVGMLIVSYFKKWNIVNVLAFLFTCFLFAGWWFTSNGKPIVPYLGAFLFATLFYIIFSLATVINNLRSADTFSKIQYTLIDANTFFYFGMGISIIESWGKPMSGLFTVGLGLYNLIFAIVLYRRFGLNKNAVYLLLGLTLTFATLTIPIQFQGNYITLFWACEAVLLFWLAQKSKINLFKWGGILVQALMLISLMMDWEQNYSNLETYQGAVSPVFLTGIVAVVTLLYTYYILKAENITTIFNSITFDPKLYRKFIFATAILVAYFAGLFEIFYQADHYYLSNSTVLSYSAAFHFIFSAFLVYFISKRNSLYLMRGIVILNSINIVLLILAFINLPIKDLQSGPDNYSPNLIAYLLHYIIFTSLVISIILTAKIELKRTSFEFLKSKYVLWLLAFLGIVILSQELIMQVVYFGSGQVIPENLENIAKMQKNSEEYYLQLDKITFALDHIKTQVVKVGFPILWGVISFILLIIGIKKEWKQVRIIALALLGLTIAKLFIYDINDASETGKIIAFILLGVLILIISFVYQKLKKLVSDEPKINNDESTI